MQDSLLRPATADLRQVDAELASEASHCGASVRGPPRGDGLQVCRARELAAYLHDVPGRVSDALVPAADVPRLIAQRLDNATLHRDSLLRIDDGKNHSEEYLQRLNQLKSIYKVLLHMSVYLRAIGAGAWETLDEHLLAVDTTDT